MNLIQSSFEGSKLVSYNQKTKPGRQRLQRKQKIIWPGSEMIGYGFPDSVLMDIEIKFDEKNYRNQKTRRQRLQRKEKVLQGSEMMGDSSILLNNKIKLKNVRIDDDNLHRKFKSRDKTKDNMEYKKKTIDSITSTDSVSDGREVISDRADVTEIKSKNSSSLINSYNHKIKLGRQRLQRKENIWPGYEVIGDGVHDPYLSDTSSYNQKIKPVRQRLQRKGKRWPGSEVISDSVSDSDNEKKRKQDEIPNPSSESEYKANEIVEDFPNPSSKREHKANENVDEDKDDIQNPGSRCEDKEKETVDDKKDDIRKELSLFDLPAQCISHIISFTTPRDACRLSVVCPNFKSAADSDSVWEKFLPSDYRDIISNSISGLSLITSLSKKDLYFRLCHYPILINNDTMSFALEQESAKKCYMLGARGLSVTWGSSPQYWKWLSLPDSRFPEVAELKLVWWFEIIGRIETKILSYKTNYAAYLVFKFVESRHGFETRPVEFDVYFEGSENHKRRKALLDPRANVPRLSQGRGNGWKEIEMGEFFNEKGDDGTVVCRLWETDSVPKKGIIVQGIELRPK